MIQWARTTLVHDVCAYNNDFYAFLATANAYLQLALYLVTGALGTQIFGFKNGLLFYRLMVESVFLFHKVTIKGLRAVINQSI